MLPNLLLEYLKQKHWTFYKIALRWTDEGSLLWKSLIIILSGAKTTELYNVNASIDCRWWRSVVGTLQNISNQYVKTLQNMTCKGALTSLDGGSGLFRSFRRRRDAGRITYNITAKIMKIIIMKKLSPTPWFGPLGTATRFEELGFSENFRKLELNTYNRCTRCLCSKIGHCEAVH